MTVYDLEREFVLGQKFCLEIEYIYDNEPDSSEEIGLIHHESLNFVCGQNCRIPFLHYVISYVSCENDTINIFLRINSR